MVGHFRVTYNNNVIFPRYLPLTLRAIAYTANLIHVFLKMPVAGDAWFLMIPLGLGEYLA